MERREREQREPGEWASELGISRGAVELYAASEVIDLHVESYLWTRMIGYDLTARHGRGPLGARFLSQVDLPRLVEAQLAGAVFSIATWPFGRQAERTRTLLDNLSELRSILKSHPALAVVSDHAGYERARAAGRVACFCAIQGGNALDSDEADVERVPEEISRITLVHLSSSTLGATSSPLRLGPGGLSSVGKRYVERMNARRILVDLAHVSREGFWDALDVHDRTQPAIVSHTGVSGVTPHWRNLDDEQLRAIAATGGVVGIIYQSTFLGDPLLGGEAASIVAHMEHVIRVIGEDFVALGSDWDGMICTPRDMPTVLELPVLVERMLARGFGEERIRKILGGNYLRVLREIRPGREPVAAR